MPEQNPQQHSELASFGEELRREREIRGISLKEIADATKISRRFLEAIERNDHKTLPAPVFTRGFVREYARYLGLNTEEIVNRYNYAAAGDDRIEKDSQLDRLALSEQLEERKRATPTPLFGFGRGTYVVLGLLLVAAAVAVWAVTTRRFPPPRTPRVQPPARATVPQPAPPEARQTATSTPAPAADPAAARDDSRLYLSLEITSNSWVTLEVDGEMVVNDELRAGTTRTFEADQQFRFRTIGNAAGVKITMNDTAVPPLGREGEVVRNRILDREYLERLRRREGGTR